MESQIIAEYGTWFLVLAFVFGLYMTWGIGANDVGNAMGTSVGSGAITVKQAVIIAGIFEFAGAFLAGGTVAGTIKSGIIDPAVLASTPHLLIYGMLASLLASGIWLMIASGRGWPVSTTHTIVGALVGFGVAGIGMHAVKWGGLGEIVASWFISPVTGGIIALVLMLSVRKLVFETDDPFGNAKKWAPFYVFLVGYIVALVTISKGLKNFNLHFSTLETQIGSIAMGIVCAIIGAILVNKVKVDNKADKSFHYRQRREGLHPHDGLHRRRHVLRSWLQRRGQRHWAHRRRPQPGRDGYPGLQGPGALVDPPRGWHRHRRGPGDLWL